MAQIEKKNSGLEKSCFIFGIASAVMAVVSFSGFVVTMTNCDRKLRPSDTDLLKLFFYSLIVVFIVGWFVMCVLLCVGICKRKAVFMRAYGVFIIVSEFVILPYAALLTHVLRWSSAYPDLIVVLVCCVVHVLGLILVYKTIHKIQREQTEIEETTNDKLIEKY